MTPKGDIEIVINHGVNGYDINLIQQIEKAIDSAIGVIGFTRIMSDKDQDKCIFIYHRLGKAL